MKAKAAAKTFHWKAKIDNLNHVIVANQRAIRNLEREVDEARSRAGTANNAVVEFSKNLQLALKDAMEAQLRVRVLERYIVDQIVGEMPPGTFTTGLGAVK